MVGDALDQSTFGVLDQLNMNDVQIRNSREYTGHYTSMRWTELVKCDILVSHHFSRKPTIEGFVYMPTNNTFTPMGCLHLKNCNSSSWS